MNGIDAPRSRGHHSAITASLRATRSWRTVRAARSLGVPPLEQLCRSDRGKAQRSLGPVGLTGSLVQVASCLEVPARGILVPLGDGEASRR